jgi:hypothetical protein
MRFLNRLLCGRSIRPDKTRGCLGRTNTEETAKRTGQTLGRNIDRPKVDYSRAL